MLRSNRCNISFLLFPIPSLFSCFVCIVCEYECSVKDCNLFLFYIYSVDTFLVCQQANAQKLAEYLSTHPRVKKVNYAGLPGHLARDLHYSQVLENIFGQKL